MADFIPPAYLAFAEAHTTPPAGQLEEVARWTAQNTAAPQMMSGTPEARLIEALIVVGRAARVLEVGTFTGFGALTMAAALPPGGRVTTLEVDEDTAATARRHIEASPYADRIELIVGDAMETLGRLEGPFDVAYFDARKAQYPDYYEAVLPMLAPSGVIVADNLFRGGASLDASKTDPDNAGMREFARLVHADERVHNVLLTIGDGVMLAWPAPGA